MQYIVGATRLIVLVTGCQKSVCVCVCVVVVTVFFPINFQAQTYGGVRCDNVPPLSGGHV